MNNRIRNLSVLLVATCALALVGRAHAGTCASASSNLSSLDQVVFNTHGCRPDYIDFQWRRYDLRSDDWANTGWLDDCNMTQVYPKHWNATFLIDFATGNDNPWWSPGSRGLHYPDDYGGLTGHDSSGYHDGQRHLMAGSHPTLLGLYEPLFATPNHLNTFCRTYDPGVDAGNATPDMRASVMVHEGTHGWWNKIGTSGGNCGGHHCFSEFDSPAKTCDPGLNTCDFFYFHGTAKYGRGTLWYQDNNQGLGQFFHSPFQNGIEFLCELATNGQEWLPTSVLAHASSRVDRISLTRIINGPGMKCGIRKPW